MFYTKVNNNLLRNENLKANTKILLLVIMSYESKEGYSYPSHSRLIKETGLSKSTLIKCLKELEELGYIISEKVAGNNNKYFIDSGIVSAPLWALETLIRSKTKDHAFRNTVSFGVWLGLDYILAAIYAVIAFCLAPWWLAIVLLLLYVPAYPYVHDYVEGCRRWFSDIRLLANKKLYKEFKHIVKDFRN